MQTFTGTNLYDALEGYEVTPIEAQREIEKHSLYFADFLTDTHQTCYQKSYNSRDVLIWLGY